MIAEKRGVISLFNILTQQPILSLDCGHTPLLSADWCHGNMLRVVAVAGTDWFIFDTSRSRWALTTTLYVNFPVVSLIQHPNTAANVHISANYLGYGEWRWPLVIFDMILKLPNRVEKRCHWLFQPILKVWKKYVNGKWLYWAKIASGGNVRQKCCYWQGGKY